MQSLFILSGWLVATLCALGAFWIKQSQNQISDAYRELMGEFLKAEQVHRDELRSLRGDDGE